MKPLHMIIIALLVVLAAFGSGTYAYNLYTKDKAAQEIDKRLLGENSYVLGSKEAKITVVEFFDPACPACVYISPIVAKLPQQYLGQVKVIYRGLAYHKGSDIVLSLLEAAKKQGKFEEAFAIFNARFTNWYVNGRVAEFVAWGVLEQAGVNTEAAKEFLDNNKETVNKILQQNLDDAEALSIKETPTFFVNQKRVKSNELIREIEERIKEVYK